MAIITIIGAGVIGGAIAYELSKNIQNRINLIDQNEPATGSTAAALGLLMGIISKKTKGRAWQLRETSIQRYKTLTTELEQLTGDKISYNNQGIVKLLFPEDNLTNWQKLSETRAKQGWKLEIWNSQVLKEKLPQLELNHNQIIGAIYSPQDGQVNPSELTKSLIKAAQINGVFCYFGKKVERIEIDQMNNLQNSEYYRIYLENMVIETDVVIVTTGLGTSLVTKLLGYPIDIRPVLGQALQLKLDFPLGNHEFQPVITGNDVHIVPLPNNEYWVGATLEFPNSDGEIIMEEQLLEQVKQEAIAFIPQLNHATIIKTWSGKRPRPYQQSAPIINKLAGYQNIILATGHYRNGVLLAPSTALKVKEILFDNITIT